MKIFQERLIEQRKLFGYTQRDMAKKLNISQPSYIRYENGSSQPTLENLILIADTFDISVDYLLGRKDLWNTRAATCKQRLPFRSLQKNRKSRLSVYRSLSNNAAPTNCVMLRLLPKHLGSVKTAAKLLHQQTTLPSLNQSERSDYSLSPFHLTPNPYLQHKKSEVEISVSLRYCKVNKD